MFRTTGSSVVTLPSRLDSWDRYKGLTRQGRKHDVNIDSSICNPEAIGDVIRYPEMDIYRTDDFDIEILRFVTFVHLPFSVGSLDLFVTSLVLMKGTSCCVIRRNLK